MAHRLQFEKQSEIGCYCILTNSFCLVANTSPEAFVRQIEDEIYPLPVVRTSCNGSSLIGCMFVANTAGVVVPSITTEEEFDALREQLPREVKLARVDENLNSLGNHIACNDFVALINPELSEVTAQILKETCSV